MKGYGFAGSAVAGLSWVTSLSAGVYSGMVDCSGPIDVNFCATGTTAGGTDINPFGVTHPLGYDGSGGTIELTVCVNPQDPVLIGPTQSVLATWAALVPATSQCRNCLTVEEPEPAPPVPYHAETALLHELGHCAMALGHPNLEYDPPGGQDVREITSYSMSYDGSSIGVSSGPDGIRGSLDDSQDAAGGGIATSVHWFRRSDNNPVVVDGTMIDTTTYSRSITTGLPGGHGWAASANKTVSASLGRPDTQSVMYSAGARLMRYTGLTADDVNMVKMARTGVDQMAGTADDYTVDLRYVADCAGADIVVEFSADLSSGTIGACLADRTFSFPPTNPMLHRHYSLRIPSTLTSLKVQLNEALEWDFRVEIFGDGFESGDLTGWTLVVQ